MVLILMNYNYLNMINKYFTIKLKNFTIYKLR